MRNATASTIATFGVIAGLAGIEHGIGEVLQGSTAPEGVVIRSWPDSAFFRILNGEPALTIFPNLLVAGLISILLSLIFIWAALFVQRKNGGMILIMLSILMLLAGAGFGPPLLGIILGAAGTRLNTPLAQWRALLPVSLRRVLSKVWGWCIGLAVCVWLLLLPGIPILNYFAGVNSEGFVYTVIVTAFGLLLFSILTAFARDMQHQTAEPQQPAPMQTAPSH